MATKSTSTITNIGENRQQPSGINFPYRLTVNAGTPDEYNLHYETLEGAAEALKSFHGKK